MKITLIILVIILILSCKNKQKQFVNIEQFQKTSSINSIDSLRIKNHLDAIINTEKPRNYKNLETLNYVASYLNNSFKKYADTSYYQKYKVNGKEYKNVIAVFGTKHKKTIVIGAHYDVFGNQDGADDNASGIVGLLELARMLKNKQLNYNIELVAYTLEEPPFFRTKNMGSYIHAKSLKDNKVKLYGMICLEMIGYFDENENSQTYPIKTLSTIYGNKANFIAVVNNTKPKKFAQEFSAKFDKETGIRTEHIKAPTNIKGIDFSDHLNYWNLDYSAVMITDTSFFRNNNYHENSDKLETLNIDKMKQVINAVYNTVLRLE